ncbi:MULTISPECIES: hypothetical protein [Flavobacterium]|uniref:Uncharacterized protein n=1 Tax=Flavobacterium jumunjinense TaxID=998845 RepID=A0ABV5GMB0_9FLAO|nr:MULTISPECIES: hypothetical protein [Flavobacterium]
MAHTINGIITSFKYQGELPSVNLVGNYFLIPFKNKYGSNYSEQTIEPYQELSNQTLKILKEFSFKGKCLYLETDYFGGPGFQIAEVWENGNLILGPIISFDGIENPKIPTKAKLVNDAINEALKEIGIYKHEGKDEFDSLRLGDYRSNDDIINEYNMKNNTDLK